MTSPENAHVSEDLTAYASRDLTGTRRAEIDAHLASCEECSQELAGVMALRAADFEPMTGPERERVTAGVRSAVTDVRPGLMERWGRRVAPALGATALVALAVVGYISFNNDAADSPADGQAAQDAAPETFGDFEDAEQDAGQGAKRSNSSSTTTRSKAAEELNMQAGTAQGAAASDSQGIGGAVPIRVVQGRRFALADLTKDLLGSRRTRDRFLGYDADTALFTAKDPDTAAVMEVCARTVTQTSPYPLVPTHAAHFAGDDIIVIAFVWRDEANGATNFMLRGWRGGDCSSVSPIYRTGPL